MTGRWLTEVSIRTENKRSANWKFNWRPLQIRDAFADGLQNLLNTLQGSLLNIFDPSSLIVQFGGPFHSPKNVGSSVCLFLLQQGIAKYFVESDAGFAIFLLASEIKMAL